MRIETFVVEAVGVGRVDYSQAVERGTQPFVTPSMHQMKIVLIGTFALPPVPWPGAWLLPFAMPQEDGTWGWTASSLIMHFFEVCASIRTNHLVTVGLLRFNSKADYDIYNIAERSPQVFGYGKAELTFLRGIPTQKGSVYAFLFGFWSGDPGEITIGYNGLCTDLTIPWMG